MILENDPSLYCSPPACSEENAEVDLLGKVQPLIGPTRVLRSLSCLAWTITAAGWAMLGMMLPSL
jgi:hypothetical protein